jgi:hypothetical protein
LATRDLARVYVHMFIRFAGASDAVVQVMRTLRGPW